MRCLLCGGATSSSLIFCEGCTSLTTCWHKWAREQFGVKGRLPKVSVRFNDSAGPTIELEYDGGCPEPDGYQETPAKLLVPPDAVHIEVPQDGRSHRHSLASSSLEDLGFYARVKATKGCTSKLSPDGSMMNLYLEPRSPAARLFAQRMMAKYRGLPDGGRKDDIPAGLLEQHQKLLPDG